MPTMEAGLSTAPKLERAPFGLETVADVEDHGVDYHWALGFQQENSLCHYKATSWEPCNDTEVTELFDQDGNVWQKVYPFFARLDDTCNELRVLKRPETTSRLLELMDIVSWKALEHELWYGEHAQGSASADMTANSAYLERSGAVDVGSGMNPKVGLAAVIERLAYLLPGSQGVVHMTPGTSVILSAEGLLEPDGKVMRVKGSGTPVVVGAGYTDLNDVGSTIYGTGPIKAHVGDSRLVTDSLAQGASWAQNQGVLGVERPVAASWDGCVHVKATVTY